MEEIDAQNYDARLLDVVTLLDAAKMDGDGNLYLHKEQWAQILMMCDIDPDTARRIVSHVSLSIGVAQNAMFVIGLLVPSVAAANKFVSTIMHIANVITAYLNPRLVFEATGYFPHPVPIKKMDEIYGQYELLVQQQRIEKAALLLSALEANMPHVLQGKTIIQRQDFAMYFDNELYIYIKMENLDDRLEFANGVSSMIVPMIPNELRIRKLSLALMPLFRRASQDQVPIVLVGAGANGSVAQFFSLKFGYHGITFNSYGTSPAEQKYLSPKRISQNASLLCNLEWGPDKTPMQKAYELAAVPLALAGYMSWTVFGNRFEVGGAIPHDVAMDGTNTKRIFTASVLAEILAAKEKAWNPPLCERTDPKDD
ncbi:MAG: hypothetical protein LBC42_03585 [Puniceicoccales bacterium]|nr:hypothetical protein [Puniceicoccales bacterium]